MKDNQERITPLSQLEPSRFACENGEAHEVAKSMGKMKITQLRKFFTQFKSIEKKLKEKTGDLAPADKNELALLNIELAYSYGRELISSAFYNRIKTYISETKTVKDLQKLVKFLEAVIAYHKYEEIKKK